MKPKLLIDKVIEFEPQLTKHFDYLVPGGAWMEFHQAFNGSFSRGLESDGDWIDLFLFHEPSSEIDRQIRSFLVRFQKIKRPRILEGKRIGG